MMSNEKLPSSLVADFQTSLLTGDHVTLASILANHRVDVNEPMKDRVLPLHCALERGHEGQNQKYNHFIHEQLIFFAYRNL